MFRTLALSAVNYAPLSDLAKDKVKTKEEYEEIDELIVNFIL